MTTTKTSIPSDSDVRDNDWLYDTFFDADWSDTYYGEEEDEASE